MISQAIIYKLMMEESLQIIHSIVDTIFVNRVTEKVESIMNLSSRRFPQYYIGNAKTLAVDVFIGIFLLRFKTSQINLILIQIQAH
jgi:hypothetical protein